MLPRQPLPHDHFGAVLVGIAIALAAIFLMLMPWQAQAQDILPTVATVDPWWMAYARPVIDAVVTAAVGAIGAAAIFALRWFSAKTGIDVDQKHEAALRNTVMSAAKSLLMDLIKSASGGKLILTTAALSGAAQYVREAVPDSIEHFGKRQDQVMAMVQGALPDAMKAAGVSADLDTTGAIASTTSLMAIGETLTHPDAPLAAPGGAGGAL